ncbi:MAG: hypothetical protein HFI82_10835 [Eubacterium sp.]|jgi:hypothetical protein|nr:hypothetical protein [Eubacterium sp.]
MAKDVKGKTSEVKANKKETAVTAEVKPAEVTPAEIKPSEVKKEEIKKEEVKKAAVPVKKAVSNKVKKVGKETMEPELYVQYNDDPAGAQEANVNDIVAKIKALYVSEGHRESSIKSLKVYMKPQEWKAYYVINNKIEGQVDLF